MKIDYSKIRDVFPNKAWVYAEGSDSVRIGKWNGNDFLFFETMEERNLLELRIFCSRRELKFTGEKCRDTSIYEVDSSAYTKESFVPELAMTQYFMYGEQYQYCGDFTKLWEDRGGILYFPGKLIFSKNNVSLKLGIRNFVRYNPIPIMPKQEKDESFGLSASGAGPLEVIDYAYTGFFYASGKEVEL